jgi:hypothetical protein
MRRFTGWSGAVSIAALIMLGAATRGDEEKVAIDKLPKAVVKAVKDRFPEAELKSAEKETENGKTVYDVEIKYKGANYEVAVTAGGEVTGYEKEIAAKDMPKGQRPTQTAMTPTGVEHFPPIDG